MTTTKRILIVDDEPPVLEVLSEFFRQFVHGHGYAVETASNGTDGFMAVLRARPDLILLDMNMPGMGGLEFLKAVRQLDRDLPVIMVTANEDSKKAAETLSTGVFAYVPKPFEFRQLDHLVSMVFQTSKR